MPGPTETNFFRRAGMEDTKLGAKEKDDPEDVARQGFEAMMAGKDRIVVGTLNRLKAAASKMMSEQSKAELHRTIAEPGSAEKAKR
jgi:short-subunit dehydrogenase